MTTVENVANEIEEYLLVKGCNEVLCIYGLSMCGGITIRILADNKVKFRNAIIDAGITPYELPWILTRVILLKDFCTTMLARRFPFLLDLVFPPDRFSEAIRKKEIVGIKHMSPRTIWRAYDFTDNYSMPSRFPDIETHIEYWYGEEEKKDRKLDLKYVRNHIPNVTFRMMPQMLHGQFVCGEPEKFCKKLIKVLEKDKLEEVE